MSQMNIWPPTKALIGHLARQATEKEGRAVKQNELVDKAVRRLAHEIGLTPDQIEDACRAPLPEPQPRARRKS